MGYLYVLTDGTYFVAQKMRAGEGRGGGLHYSLKFNYKGNIIIIINLQLVHNAKTISWPSRYKYS